MERQAASRSRTLALLTAALMLSLPTRAQYIMEFAYTYTAPTSTFISNTFLNQQAMIEATKPQAATRQPVAVPLAPPRVARSAAELSAAVPATQRAALEKLYVQLMPAYQQIEQRFGWPQDDVAGAMVALLAGNYQVLHGEVLNETWVATAGKQLRNSAAVQDLIARISPEDRRRLYEHCALLGMFMATAFETRAQQSPQVLENLRQSARANLRVALGDAADTLRFTPQGLQLH